MSTGAAATAPVTTVQMVSKEFKAKPAKPKNLKDLQERWVTYFKNQIISALTRSILVADLEKYGANLTPEQKAKIWEMPYEACG